MKKPSRFYQKSAAILLAAATAFSTFFALPVSAAGTKIYVDDGDPFQEPIKIRTTCYIDHGYTASGEYTHYGVAAGNRDWMGYDAYIYRVDPSTGGLGEFIGKFAMRDTGAGIDTDGDGRGDSIKNKTSIDIWQTNMSAALSWVRTYGDYTYLYLVPKGTDPDVPYYEPGPKGVSNPVVIGTDLTEVEEGTSKQSITDSIKTF
jgi:hypothetical protein